MFGAASIYGIKKGVFWIRSPEKMEIPEDNYGFVIWFGRQTGYITLVAIFG